MWERVKKADEPTETTRAQQRKEDTSDKAE